MYPHLYQVLLSAVIRSSLFSDDGGLQGGLREDFEAQPSNLQLKG